MKLSQYKEDFYTLTSKASEVARNSAYAGIALVWVFKYEKEGMPKLPHDLLIPISLFALCIAFDLMQYVSGSIIWGLFHRNQEKNLKDPSSDDPELSHSIWFPFVINTFFALKILSVIAGYAFVAIYALKAL